MASNDTATPTVTRVVDFQQAFLAAPRPLLLIAADPPKYTMVAVNLAHAAAFGTVPAELEGHGVLEVFPTDAGAAVDAFVAAIRTSFEAAVATGEPQQMDINPYPVALPDGGSATRYWTAVNVPVGAPGAVTHILSAIQDVTGDVLVRRGDKARALLMREVDHRARNALTAVQSIVRLTQAPDLETFREILDGRIGSLARAQSSLAAQQWEGGSMREILEAELAAMSPAGRHSLAGPEVALRPEQVQAMTMTIHELATNACKYGALSSPRGALAVAWAQGGDDVTLAWTEVGGPRVTPPQKRGFGSRLIEQLTQQLGGDLSLDWRPTGLQATLRFSLAELPPQAEPVASLAADP